MDNTTGKFEPFAIHDVKSGVINARMSKHDFSPALVVFCEGEFATDTVISDCHGPLRRTWTYGSEF